MNRTILSDELIRNALEPYGAPDDPAFRERVRRYIELLLRWNEKISLTAITNPLDILRFHFGESIFAARVGGANEGRVADIGTGPGFPGIPIRMVRPQVKLTLVEPVAKKTAFLGEVIRVLGLTETQIIRCRMEELPKAACLELDFVTARALGSYPDFLRWTKENCSENVKILLLLGNEECERLRKEQDFLWEERVLVPNSSQRFILTGKNR